MIEAPPHRILNGRAGRGTQAAIMVTPTTSSNLAQPFLLLVLRDLRLALRQGGDAAMVVAFFVLTVILFPFGVGPEAALLARIAAGILWVTALLAALLSLERLFQAGWEDGSLEALALMPLPLEAQVLAKCLAHWLVAGLPLIVIAPLLALLLHLDAA